jgi:hypothetical protein
MKEASDITSISSFISYFSTPSLIRDSISTTVLSYPFAPAACNSGKTSVLSIATLSKGYPPAISYWGLLTVSWYTRKIAMILSITFSLFSIAT